MTGGKSHAAMMMNRNSVGGRKGGGPPSSPSIESSNKRWTKTASLSSRAQPPDSLDQGGQAGGLMAPWDCDQDQVMVETNMCAEVSMVVLDTTQSVDVLHHLFAIQRSLVSKYPNLLFDEA